MIIRPFCALLVFLFAAMPASALVKRSIPSIADRVIYTEDLSPTEMLAMAGEKGASSRLSDFSDYSNDKPKSYFWAQIGAENGSSDEQFEYGERILDFNPRGSPARELAVLRAKYWLCEAQAAAPSKTEPDYLINDGEWAARTLCGIHNELHRPALPVAGLALPRDRIAIESAALSGSVPGAALLADYYKNLADDESHFYWTLVEAENGSPAGQIRLSRIYETQAKRLAPFVSWGPEINGKIRAHFWLCKAAASGNYAARAYLWATRLREEAISAPAIREYEEQTLLGPFVEKCSPSPNQP